MTASRDSICWQLWPSSIRHFYFPPISLSLSFSLGGSVPGYNTQCWQWSMTVKSSTLGCRLQPESHTPEVGDVLMTLLSYFKPPTLCRWACEKIFFPQDRLYFLVSVDTHPIWHGVNVREHLPEQTACGTSGTFIQLQNCHNMANDLGFEGYRYLSFGPCVLSISPLRERVQAYRRENI